MCNCDSIGKVFAHGKGTFVGTPEVKNESQWRKQGKVKRVNGNGGQIVEMGEEDGDGVE